MSKVHWLAKEELFPIVKNKLEKVDILLDIGCGIRPQTMTVPRVHICAEPFKDYVEFLQKELLESGDDRVYYVVLQKDWEQVCASFPPKSVDTVILGDVIEHLEKKEGLRLLKATEKIARRQIAIFTPLGFVPQHHNDGKDAWGLDGGEWQEHKSGWEPKDFGDLWEVYAVKNYHLTDNLGKKLAKPWGAMWAVKTYPGETKVSIFKRKIHLLEDAAFASNSLGGVVIAAILLRFITTLKRSLWPIAKVFLQKRAVAKGTTILGNPRSKVE